MIEIKTVILLCKLMKFDVVTESGNSDVLFRSTYVNDERKLNTVKTDNP